MLIVTNQTKGSMVLTTHILVVDDDADIRDLTAAFLRTHGYLVDTAEDAVAMRKALLQTTFDLIVLDVMMPGEDGLSVLRSLDRATSPAIIIMSVIGEEVDRIVGLEMGADDYLAKPANPRELLARIRSVLRRKEGIAAPLHRTETSTRSCQHFAGWRMNTSQRQLVDPEQVVVDLSDGEFRLLMTFVAHPQRVLTRDFLLDHSRGVNAEHFDRAIDVQVSRLRRKLTRAEDKGRDELIRTVRNEGYLFTGDVETR